MRRNPRKNGIEQTELGTLVSLNNQKYLRIDQNKVLRENNKALKQCSDKPLSFVLYKKNQLFPKSLVDNTE